MDIANADLLRETLEEVAPAHIIHVAAVHGAAGFGYETVWQSALAVNVASVHTCLEYMRRHASSARLFYASSVKAFGDPPPPVIDEATPRQSTCLYGITKNAASDLVRYYRSTHGLHAMVGHFFNHDSPRRPDSFFIPRLVRHLLDWKGEGRPTAGVATLDFWGDFGSAHEFMGLVADIIARDTLSDVVIASGRPVHASEIAIAIARDLGLSPPEFQRTAATPQTVARLDGLLAAAGRLPRLGAVEVARWILADRRSRGRDAPDA